MPTQPLDTAELLKGAQHRFVIQATLKPIAGKTRFQPAGFPEIGHVIYDAPGGKKSLHRGQRREHGEPSRNCLRQRLRPNARG